MQTFKTLPSWFLFIFSTPTSSNQIFEELHWHSPTIAPSDPKVWHLWCWRTFGLDYQGQNQHHPMRNLFHFCSIFCPLFSGFILCFIGVLSWYYIFDQINQRFKISNSSQERNFNSYWWWPFQLFLFIDFWFS